MNFWAHITDFQFNLDKTNLQIQWKDHNQQWINPTSYLSVIEIYCTVEQHLHNKWFWSPTDRLGKLETIQRQSNALVVVVVMGFIDKN